MAHIDRCSDCAHLLLELDELRARFDELEAIWKGTLRNEVVRFELLIVELEARLRCLCPSCVEGDPRPPVPLDAPDSVPRESPVRLDYWRRKHG